MKNYARKQIKLLGHTVDVDVEDVDNEVPAVKITARVGDTVIEHIHTLGPVDGALTPPTAEQVQQSLDDFREHVARKAAHRETLKQHLAKAK